VNASDTTLVVSDSLGLGSVKLDIGLVSVLAVSNSRLVLAAAQTTECEVESSAKSKVRVPGVHQFCHGNTNIMKADDAVPDALAHMNQQCCHQYGSLADGGMVTALLCTGPACTLAVSMHCLIGRWQH